MLGVAAMTDPDNGRCEAGRSLVAKLIHVNRKTVDAAVPKLAELGYVVRLEPENGGPRTAGGARAGSTDRVPELPSSM